MALLHTLKNPYCKNQAVEVGEVFKFVRNFSRWISIAVVQRHEFCEDDLNGYMMLDIAEK